MLTWEVIRENALHSYKIMNNKKYRVRRRARATRALPAVSLIERCCGVTSELWRR